MSAFQKIAPGNVLPGSFLCDPSFPIGVVVGVAGLEIRAHVTATIVLAGRHAITVANVDRPPVLADVGGKSVDVTKPLSFTLSATDPDGDGLTFSAGALPDSVNPLTDKKPQKRNEALIRELTLAGSGGEATFPMSWGYAVPEEWRPLERVYSRVIEMARTYSGWQVF